MMGETRFNATVETARNPVEAVAAAARALFSDLHPTESWDELSGQADMSSTPALARQAVYMRAARFGTAAYGRYAAGIRHLNPLSVKERQRVARVWMQVIGKPDPGALRAAARQAGVHLGRYSAALTGIVNAGGRGAVAAMIRDYSRVMSRIGEQADG
jgi:hypothetical protein